MQIRVHLLAVAALALAAAGTAPAAQAVPDPRPNIVLVLADDLDASATPYWEAMPQTEALLADRGLTFTNAFAPTPICCPARGTILTGRYGHNTGVLTNAGDEGGWATFRDNGNEERTFAVALEQAGYRTALVGKYLNGIEAEPHHRPPGWTEWYAGVTNSLYGGYDYTLNENGRLVTYGDDPQDYATDVLAGHSVDFVRRAAADDVPFLLYAAPTAPHLPLPPAPRHADHPFTDAAAPRSPNYQERDVSDKPPWLRATARARSADVARNNDTDHRNRMGSLYALDDMVAGIVDALEDSGELDDTYLVFTSDNGYNLGAHRLRHKMVPYEESLRVPLVIAGPGVAEGVEGHMTVHPDLAPTLLELAGLDVPAELDGRSLAALLAGEDPPDWRTDFVAQYAGGAAATGIAQEYWPGPGSPAIRAGQDVPSYRALRTTDELYVEWYDPDSERHTYELYDLGEDPFQLDNLLATAEGRAANADRVRELAERLDELGECSGAACSARP